MEPTTETVEIANKLIDFCKKGQNMKAIESLYDTDAVSLEAVSTPDMPAELRGLEAIKKKNKDWIDNMELHSTLVEGPYPFGDRFAVHYKYDVTDKKSGQRMRMDEVGVYTVRDNKIVREEFFYSM
ncbi:SnoaL-like domain-containing protein [Bdellovibrio sp. HCB337]|uniref:SnoaL-like domain-containing protein n=1 Tax=Bdellovibrio sp. HCB337 TaxID=3394358 RepID=UPI0039A68294